MGPFDHDDTERATERGPVNGRNAWGTHSARVISLVSRKGGVGKTTSAVNLGAAFALSGQTVLIVGADPQCGVSRTLGHGQQDLRCGLMEIFDSPAGLAEVACPSPLKDLYFVSPCVWSLEDEERYAALMRERTEVFLGEIERARNLYDTILVDCPPGMHPATRAALQASDSYLVPVQAEELCRDSLGRLLSFIDEFTSRILAPAGNGGQPPLLEGMFLTMVSDRTRMGRHVTAEVGREFAEHLYRTGIPRTVRLTEMALRGRPAVIYDRRSAGSRAYFDLMDEIGERYRRRRDGADEGGRRLRETAAGVGGEDRPADDRPETPAERRDGGAGLRGVARLMAELGALDRGSDAAPPRGDLDLPGGADAAGPASRPAWETEPDLVSLDDLLEEEQSAGRRGDEEPDWDEDGWRGWGRARPH